MKEERTHSRHTVEDDNEREEMRNNYNLRGHFRRIVNTHSEFCLPVNSSVHPNFK